MTASTIKDVRFTQFILALFEGSGWYQVDYSYAEPTTWGKNEGCGFLNNPCMDSTTKTPNFKEFCSPLTSVGTYWTGRGVGTCGAGSYMTSSSVPSSFNYWGNNTVVSDSFADNCPIFSMYSNKDCEDSTYQASSTLPNHEFYGYGGKGFMATYYFNYQYYINPFPYCFKTQVRN